jgi:hypothetical protein
MTTLRTDGGPLGLSSAYEFVSTRVATLQEEALERVIWRLVDRDGYTEEMACKLREEFLRFASLTFITDGPISPSPSVDDFWHAFILHTKDYEEFCQKHFGHYLHHEPKDHRLPRDDRDPTPGIHTKALIEAAYPEYDRGIWATAAICSRSHCDKSCHVKQHGSSTRHRSECDVR